MFFMRTPSEGDFFPDDGLIVKMMMVSTEVPAT
jgi:hypothetical protein